MGSLAVASVQAKFRKGGKPAKAKPAGLCLSKENMMMICHAGSALGEKANAAMEVCSAKAESRAKSKGKGKGKLPNAQQLMRLCRWLVKNMLERFVCSLSLGG